MNSARLLVALVSGVLFGFGLALGGMLDPSIIRNFLDFLGAFDPRLGFVFAGAVIVSTAGTYLSRRRARPVFAEQFALASNDRIDPPLIIGSALFGIGWGMVGLCPGPAIAGLVLGVPSIVLFTIAMFVGMAAHGFLGRRSAGLALTEE